MFFNIFESHKKECVMFSKRLSKEEMEIVDKVEKEKQVKLQEYEREKQEKKVFLEITDQWEPHFRSLVQEVSRKLGLTYTFSRSGSSEKQTWQFLIRRDEYEIKVIEFCCKRYETHLMLIFGQSDICIYEVHKFCSVQELSDLSLKLFEYLYRRYN